MKNNAVKFFGNTAILALFLAAMPLTGDEFVYKHRTGDHYRIISTIEQDVYVDRKFSHHAEIINRIAVEITDASDEEASTGNSGTIRAVYLTAEKSVSPEDGGEYFEWSREYESEFIRDHLGYYKIDMQYFIPMTRNVPVFPGRDLQPGDKWKADGLEVHDFRASFGIENPYLLPFNVDYVYLGELEWNGKNYPAFSVKHVASQIIRTMPGNIWPVKVQSSSDQIVYWDFDLGEAIASTGQFRTVLEMSNGSVLEYRSVMESELVEAPEMDKESIAEQILQLEIPGTSVRIEDAGVTISIENIQFMPDSSVLLNNELFKLDMIIEILRRFPGHDILVSGHTALAGTAAGRQQLSLERARAVADYLLANDVRTPERVIVQGYGAERPLADNDTEAGRERNRRVEITILEN